MPISGKQISPRHDHGRDVFFLSGFKRLLIRENMTETQGRFVGKVALITGGGRGIGKTIAHRFASEGADVLVNFFRNREPAEETVAELRALGRRAEAVRADVGDVKDIEFLFKEVERLFGGLDILINNAASGFNRPVMEQRVKGWD